MDQDLDRPWTQEAFAALIGVSPQRVSQLVAAGLLSRSGTASEWVRSYCGQLREHAAGRDDSLTRNRARESLARAEGLERKNLVESRELVHVDVLEFVLSHVARQLSTRLDALVPQIRRRLPDIPASVLTQISAEIHTCRELCAAVNLKDAEVIDADDQDIDDEVQPP